MGCTPSTASNASATPPDKLSNASLPIANINNNNKSSPAEDVKTDQSARALITSPVRRMPPPLPSASTRLSSLQTPFYGTDCKGYGSVVSIIYCPKVFVSEIAWPWPDPVLDWPAWLRTTVKRKRFWCSSKDVTCARSDLRRLKREL